MILLYHVLYSNLFFVFLRTMVVIKNNTIPYLDENVLNSFNNVTMKSIEGSQIKMNSLILCAMSHSMAISLHEDESEHTIITEHSVEELKQVKEFCMTGVCDSVNQYILLAFGLTNDFKQFSKVKNEVMEVKLEPIDYEEDDNDNDWEYENKQIKAETKRNNKKVSKTIKKKKAKVLEEEEFDDDDENYEMDDDYINNEDEDSWKPADEIFEKRNSYKSIGKLEEFKSFELPKPLEEYQKPPNKIKEDMWTRNKNKEGNNLLKCPDCELTFQKTIILRLHVIKYHNEHLQCDLCDTATKLEDAEEFKRHMFRHIVLGKGGLKECIQCGKTKKRKEHLAKHLKQKGPFHNDECSQCSEKMSSFKAYQQHVNERHSGIWKFKCGYCADLFETSRECNRHATIVHLRTNLAPRVPRKLKKEKVREICDLCGLTFASLATHKNRVHYQPKVIVEEKEQRCTQCGQIFETKLKLYHHNRNVHTKKQCPYCGDMIRCVHLNNHIRRNHTGDMPYKCPICGKGFLYQNRLDEHNNTHTGEKPFQCKYCPSVFASAGNKAAHERGHLGIKRRK